VASAFLVALGLLECDRAPSSMGPDQPGIPNQPGIPRDSEPAPPPVGSAYGSITVSVELRGFGVPDSLTLKLDGGQTLRRAMSESLRIDSVPVGAHTLQVIAVDAPCRLADPASQDVTVASDQLAGTAVAFTCMPSLAQRLLFVRDGVIYAVRLDGSDLVRLTNEQQATAGFPAVGMADTALAYVRFGSQGPEIILIRPGSRVSLGPGTAPAISAGDAPRLAFMAPSSGEIWVRSLAPLDEARNVTNSLLTWEGLPDWAPDGQQLAINTLRTGTDGIDVLTADGAFVRALTGGVQSAAWPAWSPDGSRVAFGGYNPGDQDWEIYIVNADGSGLIRLTDLPGEEIEPTWSADGELIAFSHGLFGKSEIYIMSADGSNPRNMTPSGATDLSPAFAR